MIDDAQIIAILTPVLAAEVPGEELGILTLMQADGWQITTQSGPSGKLTTLSLATLEATASDPSSGLVSCILRQYRRAAQVSRSPRPPAEKAQAAPTGRPKAESKPDEPRRVYDDEALAAMILEHLEANRLDEYTYNQISREPSIWCDWKAASRVLRRLAERGDDVIQYDVKKPGEAKAKVYKYSPERKALDRDYSQVLDVVGSAILKHLETVGSSSQIAVCGAMRAYFGVIDKAVVKQALDKLHEDGKVAETPGPRGARVFSMPVGDQVLG